MRYTADFETTTQSSIDKDGTCRVWAVSITKIDTSENVLISNNIDDFFKFCETDNHKHDNKEIFFHNLAFDGTFIVDWLLRNGYKHCEDEDKITDKCFTTLIASTGIWYMITIYHKCFNKRQQKTSIYDSLKKLPMSVDRIAKTFKLPIQKLSIDYDEYRPVGHELTPQELAYIKNDTGIVANALNQQFAKGLEKMTIGADALFNFKELLGKKGTFKYLFPELDLIADGDIRRSYKGGFVYVSPRFVGKDLHNVISFDVNSLYPSVMYYQPLPYGEPIIYDGKYIQDKKYPLYIQRISVNFKLKNEHIPTIQIKNNSSFIQTQYLETTNGEMVELMLTSVDLALLLDQYDIINIEYLGGYKFKQCRNVFKSYIDYWADIKAKSQGGERQLAKLMLNSLYGKFGTNPKRQSKIPMLDMETDAVKYVNGPVTYDKTIYCAMACFITAWARNKTIRTAQRVYKHFIYADTDSIHLVDITPEECEKLIDVHPTNLGAWKYEGMAKCARFIGCKRYIKDYAELDEDGKPIYHTTCCGLTDKDQCNFDNFYKGATFNKLKKKKTKGGSVLIDSPYVIR